MRAIIRLCFKAVPMSGNALALELAGAAADVLLGLLAGMLMKIGSGWGTDDSEDGRTWTRAGLRAWA